MHYIIIHNIEIRYIIIHYIKISYISTHYIIDQCTNSVLTTMEQLVIGAQFLDNGGTCICSSTNYWQVQGTDVL